MTSAPCDACSVMRVLNKPVGAKAEARDWAGLEGRRRQRLLVGLFLELRAGGATLSDARIRLGSSAEPGAGPLRLCLCFYSPNCNNPDVGCRQSWLASKSYLSCHLAAPGHLDEKPLVSFLLSRCGRLSRRRHHHEEGGRRGGGVRRRRGLSPISIYLSVRRW